MISLKYEFFFFSKRTPTNKMNAQGSVWLAKLWQLTPGAELKGTVLWLAGSFVYIAFNYASLFPIAIRFKLQ